jgi:endonuclease/exonuclease/phosphatase family metal-dependent hydrolase
MKHIFRRHRFVWLCLLIVALIAGAVLWDGWHHVPAGAAEGNALIGPAVAPPHGRYLRLATFNIDGGEGFDGKVDLARTAKSLQRIDFIGMNEVHGFLTGEPRNQAAALAAIFHLPYLWVPAERQWWHESFGNAIFTDLPVLRWQRVVLPNKPFAANRNYLVTAAKWNNTVVHIITTHTDWKPGGAEQFDIVTQAFLNLPTPAVLMGDLNTPKSDPKIQKLLKTAGVQEAITTILGPQPKCVDWIFLRGLETVDAGSADIGASDHPAFWAQVMLPQPSPTQPWIHLMAPAASE